VSKCVKMEVTYEGQHVPALSSVCRSFEHAIVYPPGHPPGEKYISVAESHPDGKHEAAFVDPTLQNCHASVCPALSMNDNVSFQNHVCVVQAGAGVNGVINAGADVVIVLGV
jgi:hypothetical protein